jgi:polyisoprenoid-binding protein YceI
MNHPRKNITLFLSLLIVIIISGVGNISAQTIITPDPDSRIWIEGKSNVNSFSCRAQSYEGEAVIINQVSDVTEVNPNDQVRLELKIPVRSFECGRNRMNRDLYDALRSDEFLYITFDFKDAQNLTNGDNNSNYKLRISGTLTVAGYSREITFDADGYILDSNRLRAVGKKTILMTDYNVEPPTGLLGLVRAENELTVHFDLYASPENSSELFIN